MDDNPFLSDDPDGWPGDRLPLRMVPPDEACDPNPEAVERLHRLILGDEPHIRLDCDALAHAPQGGLPAVRPGVRAVLTDPDWEALARDPVVGRLVPRALGSLTARRVSFMRRDGVSAGTAALAERVAEVLARNGWEVDGVRGASIACRRDRPVALEAAEPGRHGIDVGRQESSLRAWRGRPPSRSVEDIADVIAGRAREPEPPERIAVVYEHPTPDRIAAHVRHSRGYPLHLDFVGGGMMLWAAPGGSVVALGTSIFLGAPLRERREPRTYR